MDLTMIGIFVGLILTGMVAGIPIGQAFEHRRLLTLKVKPPSSNFNWNELTFGDMKSPTILSKEEIEDILNAKEIS
jgi:hypothetical protein